VATIGALFLVLFLLMRPMDIWPWIGSLRPLEVLATLTAIGVGVDAARGRRASGASPQLGWLGAFFVWAWFVTIARHGLDHGSKAAWSITLGPVFMVLVVLALRDASRLRLMAGLLIACTAFVSAVAVHQGVQPRQCLALHFDDGETEPDVEPDGRECEGARSCERDGKPGTDYYCERVGLFGTYSTQGRVRWRGQLDDPNEVAVLIGATVPFLAMFAMKRKKAPKEGDGGEDPTDGKRNPLTVLIVLGVLGLGLWAMVHTQSRGGQLVLGTVVLMIFVRRFGWWSVVGAVAVTLPIVLLSWREGDAAESSSAERAEILNEGLLMLKGHPILGVGIGQFSNENPINLAAHNSYLLVSAETGVLGYILWCGLIWMSVKIPLAVALHPPDEIDPLLVRFADALAASIIGMLVGVFFLSFVYKSIFFVWLGLSGALYGAVRHQAPDFRVKLTGRDMAGVLGLAVLSLVIVRLAAMTVR
jgi:O-Antigen ligase